MAASTAPIQIRPKQPEPQKPVQIPSRPRKAKWMLLALVIAAGVVLYLATRTSTSPAPAPITVKTAKVVIAPLQLILRVGGQTSAREFANITAPIVRGPESRGDLILMQLAPMGSLVKKGEQVAQIDAQSIQDHIDDLNDTIEAATADLVKRKAEQSVEWETLQQTLRVAKANYEKAKLDAHAAEVKTDIERQLLQLNLDEAEAAYKQQLADLQFKKASQAAEIRILELTKERHIRHRDRHESDFQRFTIHAPMDGMAVMSPTWRNGEMGQIQLGDRIYAGQGFMKIVNPRTMQVEGTINQAESNDVRIGQPAVVHLDAFPEVKIPGHVYSVGALASGGWRWNPYIRTIPVRVAIDGTDPKLIPDLSASADIVLGSSDAKPVVPLAAVHREGTADFVYRSEAGQFVKTPVELGMRNATQAAVLSGLQAGDEVRVN